MPYRRLADKLANNHQWRVRNPKAFKACVRRWRAKNRQKIRAQQRRWRAANRQKSKVYQRRASLKRRYGISLEQYETLLRAQGYRCAIGKRKPSARFLAVDHDHTPGNVRGLLCNRCNVAVGMLEDSSERAAQLITYLHKSL